MRKWTTSACVALAWSIVIVPLLAAAGPASPGHPAQATTSIASITQATLASRPAAARAALADAPGTPRSSLASEPGNTQASPASAPGSAKAALASASATALPVAANPAAGPVTWTVRPGDTLSAIAAALAVPGGWQALYAANRHAIGPDPDVIRPGTVLALPAAASPARYTVTPGDSLSAIATALAVPGGWQALYAANRHAIGPDPDVIRPGTVLALPRLTPTVAARPAARGRAPRAAAPASHPGHQAAPSRYAAAPGHPATGAKASGGLTPAGGMPRWLEDVLLAVGALAATAFAAEPAAALARRRAASARPAAPRMPGRKRRRARRAAAKARIILADHHRLIVTYCADDHTVYVLTPPGEDPRAVLRAARLVLPEDSYEELAGHLGVPSAWPPE